MMNRFIRIAAILLCLPVLPALAGTASAGIEVSFVVKSSCTVEAGAPAQSPAPSVSCSDASPYRVAPGGSGAQGTAWSVTF
jgi:hypothetical protein